MHSQGLHTSTRISAFRVLFSLYLTGKIADALWMQLMDVFDTHAANAEEREALALFFYGCFSRVGP